MESKVVGQLTQAEYDPEYFESNPYPIPYLNNKNLVIVFVPAMDKEYLDGADEVLSSFLKLTSQDRIKDSHLVSEYYEENLEAAQTRDLNIVDVKEIWNYVYPGEIVIEWTADEEFYVCITCGCEWEKEHGLQLVFKDGMKLTRAKGNDGIFSE